MRAVSPPRVPGRQLPRCPGTGVGRRRTASDGVGDVQLPLQVVHQGFGDADVLSRGQLQQACLCAG